MDNSISLILRPIGDFFGFIMRPIMLLLLQNVVLPFYRTFYPLAKDYGTKIGNMLTITIKPLLQFFSDNPTLAGIITTIGGAAIIIGLFQLIVTAVNSASNNIVAAIKSVACPCDKGGGNTSPPSLPPIFPPSLPPSNSPTPSNPQKKSISLSESLGIATSTSNTSTVSTKTSNSPIPYLGASSNTSAYQYLKNLATNPIVKNTSNNPDNSILAGNNPLLQRITAMESTIASWVNSGLQSLSSLPQALQKQIQAIAPGLDLSAPKLTIDPVMAAASAVPGVNVNINGNIYGINDFKKAVADVMQQVSNRGAH